MKNTTKLIVVLFLSPLCFATGCATVEEAHREKGKGVAYVYEGSFDRVWNDVPRALTSVGPFPPKIVGNNLQEGYIVAQGNESRARSVSFGLSGTLVVSGYDQNVLIFVEKIDENRTGVEVVSDRVLTTSVRSANWSPRIHGKLGETLKRVP